MISFRRNKSNEMNVNITTQSYVRAAALISLLVLTYYFIRAAWHPLLLICIAFFLALALNSPVHALSKRLPGKSKGSRSLATTISFLIVVVLLGAFLASLVPPLIRQTDSFIAEAPKLVQDFRSQDSSVGRLIRKYHLEAQVNTLSEQITVRTKNAGGTVFATAQKVGSSVFATLTILVLTFMMLVEGPKWMKIGYEILPDEHHVVAKRIISEMYDVVRGYVNGQVVLAFLAAALIIPIVLILHVSYPAALFVIIFICALIPLVGHTIGAAIVTTVALFQSPLTAVIVLGYYILYIQFENIFVQPRIQANKTNISPLLVFSSVIIGVSIGGLFGALVAIPVAGCARILLLEYFQRRDIISAPELTNDTK
jgi:predicted PurR-regulated permease PerM